MMTKIRFESVRLDNGFGEEGVLAYRDGRLLLVASRLSSMHEEMAGRWYIEIDLSIPWPGHDATFGSLDQLEQWISERPPSDGR